MSDAREYVLVEWLDAYGNNSGEWADYDDVTKNRPELINRSVGFITYRAAGILTVVPHETASDHKLAKHQVCGEMDIPETCVVRVWKLRKDGLV